MPRYTSSRCGSSHHRATDVEPSRARPPRRVRRVLRLDRGSGPHAVVCGGPGTLRRDGPVRDRGGDRRVRGDAAVGRSRRSSSTGTRGPGTGSRLDATRLRSGRPGSGPAPPGSRERAFDPTGNRLTRQESAGLLPRSRDERGVPARARRWGRRKAGECLDDRRAGDRGATGPRGAEGDHTRYCGWKQEEQSRSSGLRVRHRHRVRSRRRARGAERALWWRQHREEPPERDRRQGERAHNSSDRPSGEPGRHSAEHDRDGRPDDRDVHADRCPRQPSDPVAVNEEQPRIDQDFAQCLREENDETSRGSRQADHRRPPCRSEHSFHNRHHRSRQ